MASIINASSSGSGGIVQTADASGVLQLQSNGTTALTVNTDGSTTFAQGANLPNTFGFKNRIINGGMVIDQRNAGAAVTSNNSGQYPVDRFFVEAYGGGVLTSQQSTAVPAGFKNSTLITVTTTDTSLAATDDYEISQKIEGFNVADLGWGAAGAATVTLSFWVRSSVTGSYSVGFQNADASRSYVGTYTINSANTWEQKTITVAGDTSGTWNTGNSTGLFLRWCLATGSNRVASAANTWEAANRIAVSATANPIMGTSGATFYITGVQLEKGNTATSFDFRSYGTELALCQRYYVQIVKGSTGGMASASYFSATRADGLMPLPVPMRTTPAFSVATGTNYYRVYLAGNSYNATTIGFNGTNSQNSIAIIYNNTDLSGMTNGAGWWDAPNGNASVGVTAEL